MSTTVKMLRKIQAANERESLIKELIALRPITPVETKASHPLITVYNDSNAPPVHIDQFAPYLSRKLQMKRENKIQILKNKAQAPLPTFMLTNCATQGGDDDFISEQPRILQPKAQSVINQPLSSQVLYSNKTLQMHLKMEDCFDGIVSNSVSTSLHRLFESSLQTYFIADRVLFYHDVSSVKVLYCPSTMTYCPHGKGIVGYTQFTRKTLNIPCARSHISYDLISEASTCPTESHILCFPIFDGSSHVRCVVEVIRDKKIRSFQ